MKYSTCFWQFLIRFVELKDLHLVGHSKCRSTRAGLSTAVADKLKAPPAKQTCHLKKKLYLSLKFIKLKCIHAMDVTSESLCRPCVRIQMTRVSIMIPTSHNCLQTFCQLPMELEYLSSFSSSLGPISVQERNTRNTNGLHTTKKFDLDNHFLVSYLCKFKLRT